jgi:membrane protease YdiL (CAAX protease family)
MAHLHHACEYLAEEGVTWKDVVMILAPRFVALYCFSYPLIKNGDVRTMNRRTLCTKIGRVLLQIVFQFVYTTLFGCYSGYVFLRTRHIGSCIGIHIFCNLMGFPDLTRFYQFGPLRRYGLLTMFIIGISLFVTFFHPWTDPGLFIMSSNR